MQGLTLRQPLHRHQLSAVRLHSKHETGARRGTVIEDGTGPTYAMFAPQMRAGEVELVAEEIGQGHAHGNRPLIDGAVDGEPYAARYIHVVCSPIRGVSHLR